MLGSLYLTPSLTSSLSAPAPPHPGGKGAGNQPSSNPRCHCHPPWGQQILALRQLHLCPRRASVELEQREVKAVCAAGAIPHPPQPAPSLELTEASVGGCGLSETAVCGRTQGIVPRPKCFLFPSQKSASASQPSQALRSGGDIPIISASFLRGLSRGTTLQAAWDPHSQFEAWSPSAVYLSRHGPGCNWSAAQGHWPQPSLLPYPHPH